MQDINSILSERVNEAGDLLPQFHQKLGRLHSDEIAREITWLRANLAHLGGTAFMEKDPIRNMFEQLNGYLLGR